ncbi:MAG: transposase [Solirubrobacteraceae bacterium]
MERRPGGATSRSVGVGVGDDGGVGGQSGADDALVQLERFEAEWDEKDPVISPSWHERWDQITPFLALPDELRRIVYTTVGR